MKFVFLSFCFVIAFHLQLFCGDYYALDIRGNKKEIKTQDSAISVIMLYSGKSCHDCIIKVIDSFNQLKKQININLYIVIGTGNSVLERRDKITFVNLYRENPDSVYYFDIIGKNKAPDFSLFAKYKIDITPSLLIVNNNQELFVDYKEIDWKKFALNPYIELITNKR